MNENVNVTGTKHQETTDCSHQPRELDPKLAADLLMLARQGTATTTPESTMNEAKSASATQPAEDTEETEATNTRTTQIQPDKIDEKYIYDSIKQIRWQDYWNWDFYSRMRLRAEVSIFLSSVAEAVKQKGKDVDPLILDTGLYAIEKWQDYMLDPWLSILRDEILMAQEDMARQRQATEQVKVENLDALSPDKLEIL